MREIYVVSDLHMYNGGEEDEFTGEGAFLEFAESVPDRSIIWLGDIFELCKEKTLKELIVTRGYFVERVARKILKYVVGNHDREIANISFEIPRFMGIPVAKYYILDGILFMHGDLFDAACNEDNSQVGETITQVVGWLAENVSPEVNKAARSLESLARDVGRQGNPVDYAMKAFNLVEHFWIGEERLRGVCLGHTHISDYGVRNGRIHYWNSGCWIGGKKDITKITIGGQP